MSFPSQFLDAVSTADICAAYYALCRDHPARAGVPLVSAPTKQILTLATGRVPLTVIATRRPCGAVYQVGDLPEGVSLNFIVEWGAVEADFVIEFREFRLVWTFSSLCADALTHGGQPLNDPPYPRPYFGSQEDLVSIFETFISLLQKLSSIAESCANQTMEPTR